MLCNTFRFSSPKMHPKHRPLSPTSSPTAKASSNPNPSSSASGPVRKNNTIDMTQVDYAPSVFSTKSSAFDSIKYSYNKFAESSPSRSLLSSSSSSNTDNGISFIRRKIASTEGSFVTDYKSNTASIPLSQKNRPALSRTRELSLPCSTPSLMHSHGTTPPSITLLSPPPTQSHTSSERGVTSPHTLQLESTARRTTVNRPLATATVTSVRDRRLMVLAEGRGVSPEVGICIVHVTTGECTLSQVDNNPSQATCVHYVLHADSKGT